MNRDEWERLIGVRLDPTYTTCAYHADCTPCSVHGVCHLCEAERLARERDMLRRELQRLRIVYVVSYVGWIVALVIWGGCL